MIELSANAWIALTAAVVAVDGFAIRRDDSATEFHVVDSLRAGDWKPRALQPNEAVRIATGAALPGDGLQVVMQEDTQREGDLVRVLRRDDALHIRFRGDDVRAGQPLSREGARLDAGALALLASIGHVEPPVSPRLRVLHLTTGDEIVPPNQALHPGHIRDSNSILIRSLLHAWPCEVEHRHLPEDFELAWRALDEGHAATSDLLLVSGGASVGKRDFTRALLERLGFEIVFGQLAVELRDDPCPRETLWPARLAWAGTGPLLHPLAWSSSGDITCLAEANALIRVPAGSEVLAAGAEVEFLPTMRLTASQAARPDET